MALTGLALLSVGITVLMQAIKSGVMESQTTMEETKIVLRCTKVGAMLRNGMTIRVATMERHLLRFARGPWRSELQRQQGTVKKGTG